LNGILHFYMIGDSALNEQYAVDLRTCQNDNLLLTQENVKLRKDYEGMKKLSYSNPIVNNVAYSLTPKPSQTITCNDWDLKPSFTQHEIQPTTLQTPPHNKSLTQHISPTHNDTISPPLQDASTILTTNEKKNSTDDTFLSKQSDNSYNIYQIEALKKQLIVGFESIFII
jgi:hypothetical protein